MGESARGTYLVPGLIALVLLGVAWRVLTLGLADHFARPDPDLALSWRPSHPTALVEAAEHSAARNPARAEALARAALVANPLEGRAYRVLGQVAQRRGEEKNAVRLFELAAERSPHDLPTHTWLERYYLAHGDLPRALRQIDLLLRIQPSGLVRQLPILLRLAAMPAAQPGLARFLSGKPPWREAFIVMLSQHAANRQAVAPLVTRLRLSKEGLSNTELTAWLERLTNDHQWGEAYLAWVAALPAPEQQRLGNLYNGGFEREPSNQGFDWRFGQVPGAYIERLPTTGAGGTLALRVSFETRRIPFNDVRQLLALPPGHYRLLGRARAEGLRSERGLVWSVLCADDNHLVAGSEPLLGFSHWRDFAVDFELPSTGCGGQWLQLGVPARIPAEQQIGGRAWFDDLRIVRRN